MLSKRKNVLKLVEDEDLNETSIEEIILSDQDIDELFQVTKKGKPVNKKKKVKSTAPKSKVENILSNSLQTKKNDLDIELESDDEIMMSQPVTITPIFNSNSLNKSNKSSKEDDDDDIICVSDSKCPPIVNNKNSNASDDICIIDSNPTTSTSRPRGRRSLNLRATGCKRSEISSTPSKPDNFTRTVNSTANVSFNSSFDTTELDPDIVAQFKFVKTLRLKFKFKGSYKCIPFKSTDKFKDKLDEMCNVLEVTANSLLLMFNDKPISFESTPEELNIGICDIIDVYEKKQNLKQNLDSKEDPNLFKFKFRDRESRKRVEDIVLTMNRYDTFQQIFKDYAELKQLPLSKISFEFDGDLIDSNQKPDDLEMESDYLIDVKIKN